MNKTRRQGGQLVLPDLDQLRVNEQPQTASSGQRGSEANEALFQTSLHRARTACAARSANRDERRRRVSAVNAPSAQLVDVTTRQRRISAFELPTRSLDQAEEQLERASTKTPTPIIRVDRPPSVLPARRRTTLGQHSRPSTAASLAVKPEDRARPSSLGNLGLAVPVSVGQDARRRSSGAQPADGLSCLERRLPLVVDPRLADFEIKQLHSAIMCKVPHSGPEDVPAEEAAPWSELWRLQANGEKAGQIGSVRGICLVPGGGGRVAVTEHRNARVQLFDCRVARRSSNILHPPGAKKRRRRFQPAGICSIPDYVSSRSAWLAVTDVDRVLLFDEDSGKVDELNVQGRTGLFGVALTGRGRLVLTDAGDRPTVSLHDFTSGQLIHEFDVSVEFEKPLHVATNVDFSITCVADSEQRCVFLFERDGRILLNTVTGGVSGSSPTCRQFTYPAGICCVDEGRQMLIVDSVDNSVSAYDFRNRRLLPVLTAEEHGLRHPSCIAADDKILAVVEEFDDLKLDHCQLKIFSRR